MWLRPLGFVLFSAFVFQSSFPPDTAQTLRERYGQPISETYLVKPGVVIAASYGPSGRPFAPRIGLKESILRHAARAKISKATKERWASLGLRKKKGKH